MKVLGIAGSLRAKSNTLQYVDTALKVIEDQGIKTELISLRGKEIKPCNGCYGSSSTVSPSRDPLTGMWVWPAQAAPGMPRTTRRASPLSPTLPATW